MTLYLRGQYSRIFNINDNGDLTISDLKHLNNTEAHLVAIAKDSGSPPRETSVPVLVRFGEQIFLQRKSHKTENEKFTLTVVLGLLLTIFLIVCMGLLIYICKDKKKRKMSPVHHETDHGSNLWTNNPTPFSRSEPDLYMATSTKSSSVTSLPQLANSQVALNPLNPQSNQRYASVTNLPTGTIIIFAIAD